MKTTDPIREFPSLSPQCKYAVWMVALSPRSVTNPMAKKNALKMIKERRDEGKYAELIKAWSCVQSKNL